MVIGGLNHFWQGKNVLITGHTGFKGSWLSILLNSLGANVIGYSLDPVTDPNLYEIIDIQSNIADYREDIRNISSLDQIAHSSNPDIIIHLAAQALVGESYIKPVATYETNVMGTVNILETARSIESVRVVLIITSDKCYENREINYSYNENDPMGGYDPYSSSKGCAELVTSAFTRSFFQDTSKVAVASARSGNVIGGGDWGNRRIVPDAIAAFKENKILYLRNPKAVRPWQHVLEPLSGYLTLCEKMWANPLQYSEGWNFGPEDENICTVGEVADRLSSLWGKTVSWKKSIETQIHEASLLKLDISKAKERLDWFPKWNLEIALEKTISWYKSYYNGENMKDITLQQLEEYLTY